MELTHEDMAPFIGRLVIENLALSKEVEQLRARVVELEGIAGVRSEPSDRPAADGISGYAEYDGSIAGAVE